jgi:hypothetical protein
MTAPRFEQTLRASWGRDFEGFSAWPLEMPGVPHERAGILDVIRSAPERALEYVGCRRGPGETMRKLALPRDRAELFAPDPELRFVLRAGNVAVWCEPVAAWCRQFAALVGASIGSPARAVFDVRAEIYVTAPGGITAFHADPSHNFTHQVQGEREIHAFSNTDPRLIDEESRAGVYLHRACYPVYRAECEDRARRFALAPGNCCYLPPLTAHWIQNGDKLSISYVLSVRTQNEIHEKLVHGMNARLRAFGCRPAHFGARPASDRVKAGLERKIRRARHWFARHVQRIPDCPYLDPLEM